MIENFETVIRAGSAVWIATYLLIISLISVILTVADKVKAINHKWRIRESTLLIFGGLGGAFAMLITMKIIRHKTQKKKFMIGLPVEIILQILLLVIIICKIAM